MVAYALLHWRVGSIEMKVHELLDRREKFTKHALARNSSDCIVNARSVDAVSWCIIGAIKHCYGNDLSSEINCRVKLRLEKITGKRFITTWNDHPDRTFDEVRALALELDI